MYPLMIFYTLFLAQANFQLLDFPRVPSVYFTDDNNLPTTSTCDVSITFPKCFDQLSYEKFKEVMNLCILNSCGFGGV